MAIRENKYETQLAVFNDIRYSDTVNGLKVKAILFLLVIYSDHTAHIRVSNALTIPA
jgi:hypothetical protein